MVKLFKNINLEGTENEINKWLQKNPNYEITAISHSDLGRACRIGIAQWMTLVVYKNNEGKS